MFCLGNDQPLIFEGRVNYETQFVQYESHTGKNHVCLTWIHIILKKSLLLLQGSPLMHIFPLQSV